MQLSFSNTSSFHSNTSPKIQAKVSYANEHSTSFQNENDINTIEKKNLVDNYFKIFDESYSEVTIKNLITARLQASTTLPKVHNTQEISFKSKELLDFTLSV